MTTPCEGCALGTKGAACEPYNALRAQICALGGIPFMCHAKFDWQNAIHHLQIPSEQRKMCGGWQREVAALKAAGRFDEYRSIRRAIAQVALRAIEEMIQCSERNDDTGHFVANRTIKRCIRMLAAKRAKFEKMKLNVF